MSVIQSRSNNKSIFGRELNRKLRINMWKITFVFASIAALVAKTNSQFGFNSFTQQNKPQKFQSDFSFPQNDFVFPGYNSQPVWNMNPVQRPNYNQQRPNSNQRPLSGNTGGRPPPTFAQKFTTVRTTPITFAPSSFESGFNRIESDDRISQTSKRLVATFGTKKPQQFQVFLFFRVSRIFKFGE